MSYEAKFLTIFFLSIVLSIAGLLGLINHLSKKECLAVSKYSTVESEYHGLVEGCFVKVDGRFIPKDNWRGEYENK